MFNRNDDAERADRRIGIVAAIGLALLILLDVGSCSHHDAKQKTENNSLQVTKNKIRSL